MIYIYIYAMIYESYHMIPYRLYIAYIYIVYTYIYTSDCNRGGR